MNREMRFVLPLLVVCTLVLRGVYLVEPPGRDQTLFMAQASALLEGATPYTDIWEHKPPGVMLVYALGMALLGRGYLAVQIINGLAGLFTATMVWSLARRAGVRPPAAILAACLYLLYFCGPMFGGFWCVGQSEVFIDCALVAAARLLFFSPNQLTLGRILGAGACCGLAFTFKYSALPSVLALVGLAAVNAESGKRFRTTLAVCAGIGIPLVLFAGYALATGSLGDFYRATVLFNLVHQHVGSKPLSFFYFKRTIFYSYDTLAPLNVFAILGLVAAFRRSEIPRRIAPVGAILFVASVLAVFWQSKFWIYHVHVVVLPLCIMSAAGLEVAFAWLVPRLPRAAVPAMLGALAISLLSYGARLIEYEMVHPLAQYLLGRVSKEEFLMTYMWGGFDYEYVQTRRAATRVERETKPGDHVFVLGFEPGVYWLANRPSSSRFYYDYPLSPEAGAFSAEHLALLMQDLRTRPPQLLLVLRNDANSLEKQSSWEQLRRLEPLKQLIKEEYKLAWREGDFICFARRPVP